MERDGKPQKHADLYSTNKTASLQRHIGIFLQILSIILQLKSTHVIFKVHLNKAYTVRVGD